MFNFIRDGLMERGLLNQFDNTQQDDLDDDLFIESAHILDELSDLSKEGTNDGAVRSMNIAIPAEEDLEIDVLEFNAVDGRVTDIPMDAAQQEAFYEQLKTRRDFIQEAYSYTSQLPREGDTAYRNRVLANADREYKQYMDKYVQEGMFGFGMIKLDNSDIIWNLHFNFGPMKKGEADYTVILPVLYEHEKNRIYKKQLETAKFFDYNKFEEAEEIVKEKIDAEGVKLPKNTTVWDVVRPTRVFIPIEPKDSYTITLELHCRINDADWYYSFGVPIKEVKNASKNKTFSNAVSVDKVIKSKYKDDSIVNEFYEARRPDRFGIYQEAIENAGDGDIPDLNETTPNDGNQQDAPPAIDNGEAPPPPEDNTNADAGTEPVEANTNDVSDQIAEKVAADTSGPDAPGAAPTDMSDIDNNPVEDIPADVDAEVPTDGDAEIPADAPSVGDVDNMTIEQLKEMAAEKVESMTINQIKDFLANGDTDMNVSPTDTEVPVEGDVQESFKYSKSNINNTMDVLIRNALGILNNSEMELPQIIRSFKINGKKLNRCLVKATKMKSTYDETERNEFSKLNKCLLDFMSMVKDRPSESATETVKRLIKEFTAQCKRVGDIINKHKGTPIQESFEDE